MDSNIPVAPIVPTTFTSNKPKKRYFFVITTIILMVLTTVGIGVVVGVQMERVNQIENTDNIVLVGTIKTSSTLEFVKANLPDRWTIKEYKDGQRSKYMIDANYDSIADTYKGLGAIEIINPRNEIVFSMTMIYGIGGTATCDPIYKFTDTEERYINTILEGNKANGVSNAAIIDLTSSDFGDYNLFGLNVRYVGTGIYVNSDYSNTTNFNPSCDELKDVVTLTDPKIFYVDDNLNDGEATSIYKIISNPQSYDLEGLHQILSSLKSK